MNTALSDPAQTVAEEFHDWRATAPCASLDPELFFDLAEEDPAAEAEAKAVCKSCPLADRCLNSAMLADEEWGIWGGMTPEERRRYRTMWERQNGGRGVLRSKRTATGILIHDPSIERRYSARQRAAKRAHDILTARAPFHRREDYLAVLELIITHPTESSAKLASRSGMSKTWFNTNKREAYALAGVSEIYTGEIA